MRKCTDCGADEMPYVRCSPYHGLFRCSNFLCTSHDNDLNYLNSIPSIIIDEAPDFNSNKACPTCYHLTYFLHLFDIYRADDEGEPDLFVWRCTLDGCGCISAMPMFPIKN